MTSLSQKLAFEVCGFLLHYKYDAIQFTEIFKLVSQLSIWNIDESLIVSFAYVGILLKCFIIAHNKSSNIMIDTVINHFACSLVHVVIYSIVSLRANAFCLLVVFFPKCCLSLMDCNLAFFLIEPLVNGLQSSSIDDECFTFT